MASAAVLPFYYHRLNVAQESLSHDLVLPFLVHAGIWSSVAATAGLAFEIGLRSRQRLALVALHGLLGGLLGTAIYEVARGDRVPRRPHHRAAGRGMGPATDRPPDGVDRLGGAFRAYGPLVPPGGPRRRGQGPIRSDTRG